MNLSNKYFKLDFEKDATSVTWQKIPIFHVHVIYFSINLLQDMEIVVLITIKGMQQHRVYI